MNGFKVLILNNVTMHSIKLSFFARHFPLSHILVMKIPFSILFHVHICRRKLHVYVNNFYFIFNI
jgi:hypothetical protein